MNRDFSDQPATYLGRSDDEKVEAIATQAMRVAAVRVELDVDADEAGDGIVQAVNRALDSAANQVPDVAELQDKQQARATEFSSLIGGFEAEVSRTASRITSRG